MEINQYCKKLIYFWTAVIWGGYITVFVLILAGLLTTEDGGVAVAMFGGAVIGVLGVFYVFLLWLLPTIALLIVGALAGNSAATNRTFKKFLGGLGYFIGVISFILFFLIFRTNLILALEIFFIGMMLAIILILKLSR